MQVYIICSKRWVSRVNKNDSSPAFLNSNIENNLSTVDLMIRTMNFSLSDVYLIGGYHIEKLVKRFSGLKFLYEDKWTSKNWSICQEILDKTNKEEILFISSEIIFNDPFVKLLKSKLKQKRSFICTVNKNNIDELEKKQFSFEQNGHASRFAGIIYFSNNNFSKRYSKTDNKKIINFFEIYMLSNLSNKLLSSFDVLDLRDTWETIFKDKALAKSLLGTKAETLNRLRPLVKKSKFLPTLLFSVSDWSKSQDHILLQISNFTSYNDIIIRSSTNIEDSWTLSHAGAFNSFLNISKKEKHMVIDAINQIINGYKKSKDFSDNWQILIQPQQNDIKLSGVSFTSSVSSGSPYIEIYYDDSSQSTDSVTSGTGKDTKSIILFKKFAHKLSKAWEKKLVLALLEIERLISYDKLDIEFCIPNKGLPIIFQVRPITGFFDEGYNANEFEKRVIGLSNFYKKISSYTPSSDPLILSDTSDWNPAEMIGENVAFFEKTLYDYLITTSTWSKSRKLLGYNFDHNCFDLMLVLANKPFINVNKSINSLIPSSLDQNLKEKIVSCSLNYLKINNHKHSEIEFEVIPNCYFPGFEKHWKHILCDNVFSSQEQKKIRNSYKNHTLGLIKNTDNFIETFNQRIVNLNINFKVFQSAKNNTNFLKSLINTAKDDGVLPFAIAARLGFVSLQWLNSIEKNLESGPELVSEFLSSIPNVATNISNDLQKSKTKGKNQELFLKKYGFLRPNSYDLSSDDYFELASQGMLFDNKFDCQNKFVEEIDTLNLNFIGKNEFFNKFSFNLKTFLNKNNFKIDEKQLMRFLVLGILSREYMKFAFMRHVWGIMEVVKGLSTSNNFNLEDAKFIKIEEFIDLEISLYEEPELQSLLSLIRLRQKRFSQNMKIKLPEVVTKIDDIYSFYDVSQKGYFISNHKIKGKIVEYKKIKSQDDLKGKIIIIESADPGFDWIFSKGILGFITCHGGLGSHMAIRANEFDMPALIGCGTKIFSKFIHDKFIELDCNNKNIGFF